MQKIEMVGKQFGRLLVISENGKTKDNHIKWLCKCECGNYTTIDGRDLRKGSTKSCGCLLSEKVTERIVKLNTSHGDSNTRLYSIWCGMLDRCRRSKNAHYKDYGGRGIKVCKEWQEYPKFKKWAIDNGYSDNLSIDRINVNGNYEPLNCRWVTMKIQSINKRTSHKITYNGSTLTVTEWNNKMGYKKGLIADRLSKGWNIERAINEKPFIGKNQYTKLMEVY